MLPKKPAKPEKKPLISKSEQKFAQEYMESADIVRVLCCSRCGKPLGKRNGCQGH